MYQLNTVFIKVITLTFWYIVIDVVNIINNFSFFLFLLSVPVEEEEGGPGDGAACAASVWSRYDGTAIKR